MKKGLLIVALIATLGACSAAEKTGTKEPIKIVKVDYQKRAILLPINNTNDQPNADLFWKELSKSQQTDSKTIDSKTVKKEMNKIGYSLGDQLTQLTTVDKKINFQNKIGADNLVFLTVNKIDTSLSKNPFNPKTTKTVSGTISIFENGKEINKFNVEGQEDYKISAEALKTALTIGKQMGKNQDYMAAYNSIKVITDPKLRGEVSEAVLALSGPLSTKLSTLMQEKGLLKGSPYKGAIDKAVKEISKSI